MKARSTTRVVAALLLALASLPAGAGGYQIHQCREVRTSLEDPFPPLGDDSPEWVAEVVCEGVQQLAPQFGVRLDGRTLVDLLICESNESFHRLTGKGPWVAAVFNPRVGIVTQPAHWLARGGRRRELGQTVLHELTHYFVHRASGGRCPTWLNEGLAQWFSGLHPRGNIIMPSAEIVKLERRWRLPPTSIAVRRRDYWLSLQLTAKVIRRAGLPALLEALPAVGNHPPAGLDLELAGRPLRHWLLGADPGEQLAGAEQQDERKGFEILRGEHWLRQIEEDTRVEIDMKKARVIDFRHSPADGPTSPVPALQGARQRGKSP